MKENKAERAEFQATVGRIEKLCRCDTVNTGVISAEVKCAVSYGPRLHAVGAYLLSVHYLPVARTAAVFKDLFQIPVSTGWVSSLGQNTFVLLADTVVLIMQAVTASTVAHVDETQASSARLPGLGL